MIPCSGCHRHLRSSDDTCPFCGVRQRAERSPSATLGAFALVAAGVLGTVGCGPGQSTDIGDLTTTTSSSSTDTTTDSETSDTVFTTSTSESETDSATDTNQTSLSFYAGPDDWDFGSTQCDPWLQDCPDGEKCVPYASTGGSLDANKCVEVLGEGMAGEPCVYTGPVEANDDCGADTHCFNVADVDGQLIGTCAPFCAGSPDDPICADGSTCLIANDGSTNLCIDSCHPLMQDCAPDQVCESLLSSGALWGCLIGPESPPGIGQPCSGQLASCGLGQMCVPAEFVPGCAGLSCCTEYCDVDNLDFMCSNPQLGCESLFELITPPPGYENIGICASMAP